jgi:hypothetical protein
MPNEEMTISPISSANKSGYKPEEEWDYMLISHHIQKTTQNELNV